VAAKRAVLLAVEERRLISRLVCIVNQVRIDLVGSAVERIQGFLLDRLLARLSLERRLIFLHLGFQVVDRYVGLLFAVT